MKNYLKKKIEIIGDNIFVFLFIFFAMIEGALFSFLLPFGQIPDEMTHYRMIESEFGTNGIYSEIENVLWYEGGYYKLQGNSDEKVSYDVIKDIRLRKFENKLSIKDFRLSIKCVRHLPAAIGLYLGAFFGLPIIMCTHLAELFSLLFFIIVGALSVKITPVKKDIFTFCLLLPECLQQCTSVNYDAVLIPCSFLLFAFVLELYYSDLLIDWKKIIVVLSLTLMIFLTKPPYSLIALSIFIVPFSKYNLKIGDKVELMSLIRKYWYLAICLLGSFGVLYIYLNRNNPEIKTMASDVLNIPKFFRLLINTYNSFFYYHLKQMIGIFGWLDSEVGSVFVLIVFMLFTFLTVVKYENKEYRLNIFRRGYLLLIIFLIILLIEMAMQSYTYEYLEMDRSVSLSVYCEYLNDLSVILGVQGRYWIPFLPMLLVSISGNTKRNDKKYYFVIQIAYYVLSFVYVYNILHSRYW